MSKTAEKSKVSYLPRLLAAVPFLLFVWAEYHWANRNGIGYLFSDGLFGTIFWLVLTGPLLLWASAPFLSRDRAAASALSSFLLMSLVALAVFGFGVYCGATMFLYGWHVHHARTSPDYVHATGRVNDFGGVDFTIDGQTHAALDPTDTSTVQAYLTPGRLHVQVNPGPERPAGSTVELLVYPSDPSDYDRPFWVAGYPYHVLSTTATPGVYLLIGSVLFLFCAGVFVMAAFGVFATVTGKDTRERSRNKPGEKRQ